MSARALCFLAWLLVAPALVTAQGFAGLGTEADGFAVPDPAYRFDFPADHGPHPTFRIEWWYLTANMTSPDGTDYGLQWTLFRSALAPRSGPGWANPQIWFAHAAITTPQAHFVAERVARGGIGQAGATAAPFAAWIDDWRMADRAGTTPMTDVSLTATGDDFAYDVRLRAVGPIVPQGRNGYSVKSAAGQASHYYSQPFFRLDGTLTLPSGDVPVTGQAWLDREWSSQPLAADQSGWDWVSLQFESGGRLMGFRLRDDGPGFTSATWIDPDGTPTPYTDGALTLTPLGTHEIAGRDIPVRWRVELPDRSIDAELEALNPNAWMTTSFPYWEGPVRITGSHTGSGYLEMTGY